MNKKILAAFLAVVLLMLACSQDLTPASDLSPTSGTATPQVNPTSQFQTQVAGIVNLTVEAMVPASETMIATMNLPTDPVFVGQTFSVSWDCEGAESAKIDRLGGKNLPNKGSESYTASVPGNIDFNLTCKWTEETNIAGGVVVVLANPATPTAIQSQALSGDINISNPYMLAYQDTLEYTVPENLSVPTNLLSGFEPVKSLVMTNFVYPNGTSVSIPDAPADVSDWFCFPQDYSNGDDSNPGCKALQDAGKLPWDKPVAGYNDGNNWSSDSPDGWSASDIQAENWRVVTGYQVCHPAVGCIKDPDGGAVMILFINFHDSDEVWNVRNHSAVFIDSGFEGYGVFWNLGPDGNVGEGIADLRNHYLYNLSAPVSTDDNHYRGQCGDSGLCETITYVVVARVWDRPELGINFSHFELLDYGQWHRP